MIGAEFLGHGFTLTPALGGPLGRTGGKLRRDPMAERILLFGHSALALWLKHGPYTTSYSFTVWKNGRFFSTTTMFIRSVVRRSGSVSQPQRAHVVISHVPSCRTVVSSQCLGAAHRPCLWAAPHTGDEQGCVRSLTQSCCGDMRAEVEQELP
jgi:hypothetical protein